MILWQPNVGGGQEIGGWMCTSSNYKLVTQGYLEKDSLSCILGPILSLDAPSFN